MCDRDFKLDGAYVFLGIVGKRKVRFSGRHVFYLDILQAKGAKPFSKCLYTRFFGGKASRKNRIGVAMSAAIDPLSVAKDTRLKTFLRFHRFSDAIHLNDIGSYSYDFQLCPQCCF
ncbi:MAG: hypothetical protein A3F09_03965 [Chlamydiae bacterium RIFCSPHIGHO2_12_FULL_49_11]|nr:MAG: hypothetical protein A3F09_03965 [Chlamydiae bacterium RIFCSPHIGHO2_12_FULL_49_11]